MKYGKITQMKKHRKYYEINGGVELRLASLPFKSQFRFKIFAKMQLKRVKRHKSFKHVLLIIRTRREAI